MKIVEKVLKVLLNKNQNSEKKPLTFVSVISDFIEQKKRELGDLSKKGKKIGEEINQYTFQKKELIQRIRNLDTKKRIGCQNILVHFPYLIKHSWKSMVLI